MGVTGVVEAGAVGIALSAAILGSSRMFVAIKKNDVQNSQRVVPGNDRKKRKRRFSKDKKTHTYSLGFLLTAITVLVKIRNPHLYDRLVLGIFKDLLGSLIRRQIYIRPLSGRVRNG